MSDPSARTDRERQLDAVLADYLEAKRQGAAPTRDQLVARHPELAAELDSFLADHAALERVAPPPRPGSGETVSFAADPNAATAAPGGAPPAPGTTVRYFGDYELLGEVARGGMGVVYRARHVKLNRTAALKMVLGAARADSKEIIRFLAEAEAVAAVRHPHVVGVYEFGDADGRPFLALEFCPGGTLAERLKAGRLAPRAAAELVRKVAGGVAAAHALGIVHRDLKPGNVLFDESEEPKVSDFGLAKRGAGAELTQSQAVLGTPAYMSPEQAKGDTKFVGPQADVWALGVILYECLTGERPFADPDQRRVLFLVATEEPQRPRKIDPSIPRDLETVCLKCLEKDPGDRYPTAAALADDLRAWAAGRAVSVRSRGRLRRLWDQLTGRG